MNDQFANLWFFNGMGWANIIKYGFADPDSQLDSLNQFIFKRESASTVMSHFWFLNGMG